MTNQRDLRDNQLDEDLLFTLKEIDHGLDAIENGTQLYTPNLEWFENFIVEEKEKQKKKLIFDVILFAFIAMFILSAILFALHSVPVVFFTIQGVAVIVIISFVFMQYVKQVKET